MLINVFVFKQVFRHCLHHIHIDFMGVTDLISSFGTLLDSVDGWPNMSQWPSLCSMRPRGSLIDCIESQPNWLWKCKWFIPYNQEDSWYLSGDQPRFDQHRYSTYPRKHQKAKEDCDHFFLLCCVIVSRRQGACNLWWGSSLSLDHSLVLLHHFGSLTL